MSVIFILSRSKPGYTFSKLLRKIKTKREFIVSSPAVKEVLLTKVKVLIPHYESTPLQMEVLLSKPYLKI